MTIHTIGVISDTHGLLRPQAVSALTGVDQILHAGDAGKPEILQELASIAPLTAVRGNVDRGPWAQELPLSTAVQVNGVWIYILHDLAGLDINPQAAGFSVVISGHSHQPQIQTRQGVLYLNPGSAGPRRFKLPVSLALLQVQGKEVSARLLTLDV